MVRTGSSERGPSQSGDWGRLGGDLDARGGAAGHGSNLDGRGLVPALSGDR